MQHFVQVALIGMLAYLSYLCGELLGISGIVSLFCCGVIISHYVRARLPLNPDLTPNIYSTLSRTLIVYPNRISVLTITLTFVLGKVTTELPGQKLAQASKNRTHVLHVVLAVISTWCSLRPTREKATW